MQFRQHSARRSSTITASCNAPAVHLTHLDQPQRRRQQLTASVSTSSTVIDRMHFFRSTMHVSSPHPMHSTR